MLRNLVIRMLWSIVSKAADRSSSDKQTHNHCLKPEADHLLHAPRRSQCCDTLGRQTRTVLEGCETANAVKTVSEQYSPVPFTRMANWKQAGSVSSRWDQDWPISQRFDKSMFKTLWYNTRWQRLIHDTGHYGNNFVQTIIKDRGGYGVKVTRLFWHFLDYGFFLFVVVVVVVVVFFVVVVVVVVCLFFWGVVCLFVCLFVFFFFFSKSSVTS